MAGERVKLEVARRDERGSATARRLRGRGFIPGVLYGDGKEAISFAVPERELRRALGGEHGTHAILDVVLDGDDHAQHAVLKEFQLEPVKSRLLHVDLQEIRLDRAIQTQVAVELVGTPEGVVQGGVLNQVTREVSVEALPMEVPDRLPLDVAHLAINDSIRLAELAAPEGVKLLDDPDTVIASVAPPRVEIEEVEEEVEGEGEELEEAAAEESAAEVAESEPESASD
jgi:large subunit ribosomal protein L25